MLTLANPKAILFFLALLPTVIDLASMNTVRFVEISAAIIVVLPVVLGTYALLAARARRALHDAEGGAAAESHFRRRDGGRGVVVATR